MMPFEKEYKMRVQLEAKYALESIIDSAKKYNYEKDLYLEDVVKEIKEQLKEKE